MFPARAPSLSSSPTTRLIFAETGTRPSMLCCALEVLGKGQGRCALQHHEIVVRQDPPQFTVLDHHDVVDVVFDHLEHCFKTIVLGIDPDERKVHDVLYRTVHVPASGHDLLAKVPVRDDARGQLVPIHDNDGTDPVLRHFPGSVLDGRALMHGHHLFPGDIPDQGREQEVVAASVEEALRLHLSVGLVDIFRKVGLQQVFSDRGVVVDQAVDGLLVQEVADGIVDSDNGRLLPVLAHERDEAEGVAFSPVVNDHVLAVLGFDRDPDAALLDDLQAAAGRTVLLQNDGALGVKFHGNILNDHGKHRIVQELKGRYFFKELHYFILDHDYPLVAD